MSSWTNFLQSSNEYEKGVEDYLDKAFATQAIGDQITCPCKVCYNRFWHDREKVYNHLIANGIQPGTEGWNFRENGISSMLNVESLGEDNVAQDDMDGLIYDTHRDMAERFAHNLEGVGGVVDAETKKFYRLVEDGKQELFRGCKTFSKLSFLIRLYLLKCVHGMTNSAFSDILDLLRELLPEAKLPKSFNEAKKLVKDLGLHYDKIHACRNDCMLYWKEHEAATSCHVCQASRWKENENQSDTSNESTKLAHKVPAKVVWHFPLKPRLQRLYMCSETSDLMRWHEERREKDGFLRHRADGEAWKEFD